MRYTFPMQHHVGGGEGNKINKGADVVDLSAERTKRTQEKPKSAFAQEVEKKIEHMPQGGLALVEADPQDSLASGEALPQGTVVISQMSLNKESPTFEDVLEKVKEIKA